MGGRRSSPAPSLIISVERFGRLFNFFMKVSQVFPLCVCVPYSFRKRYALLSAVQEKFQELWPTAQSFTISLTGHQSQTSRTSNRFLAVCICDPDHQPPVPFSANLLGIRSKPSEGLRVRCLEKKCCHRSASELSAAEQLIADSVGQAPDVRAEITPDDLEEPEDTFEEEAGEVLGGGAEATRDLVQELWPHAAPRRYWETMLDLIGAQGSHAIVVGTTSAHPALMLAARGKGLQARLLRCF